MFIAFRQLEHGKIDRITFLAQLENVGVAVETKLEELKREYKEAEDELFIHFRKYFERFVDISLVMRFLKQ